MPEHRLSNRTFGLALGAVLLCVAAFFYFLWNELPLPVLYAGTVLIILGLIAPILLLPLNRVWMWFAQYIFLATNFFLLGIAYFLLIVPVGLFMRVVGRDPLAIRKKQGENTYLTSVSRQATTETLKNFF